MGITAGHIRLFSFFVFILIFCFAACRGVKTSATVETKTEDSLVIREIKSAGYESIPLNRVLIKIPVRDIAGLPSSAGYSGKDGRAGLDIVRLNDTVYVSAVCDSLQRRVEYYEMTLHQARHDAEMRVNVEKRNNVQMAFKWCLIGVLTGSAITVSVKKIFKKIRL
jgi:hypothetical protein